MEDFASIKLAPQKMTRGYLYVAYGQKHVAEAIKSVATLRAVEPHADVTLVTRHCSAKELSHLKNFDHVEEQPLSGKLGGKVEGITNKFYYDNTIYLDTDTYICRPLERLFDLLEPYDLVVCPDPGEIPLANESLDACPPPNTGVFGYTNYPVVREFFDVWREYYSERELWRGRPGEKQHNDQPAFALAMRDSNIRSIWAPQNWNFRYRFSSQLHAGHVKIIHGPDECTKHEGKHGEDCVFPKLEAAANASLQHRCWNPKTLSLV